MNKCDVSISKDLVKDIIDVKMREAISDALGKNPEALISAVVKTALGKNERSYSSSTIFQEGVNKMIREAAQERFKEWLAGKK